MWDGDGVDAAVFVVSRVGRPRCTPRFRRDSGKRRLGLWCETSCRAHLRVVTARAMEAVVSAATSNVDWADDTSSSAVDAAKARVSMAHTPNFFCAYALNDLASFLHFCRSA